MNNEPSRLSAWVLCETPNGARLLVVTRNAYKAMRGLRFVSSHRTYYAASIARERIESEGSR